MIRLVLFLLLSFSSVAQTVRTSNLAELRTTPGSKAMIAITLGSASPTDGGGGTFYWDETSTLPDNGVNIIAVTGIATGRWILKMGDGGAVPISVTSLSGSTAETTIFTKTIKANTLSTGRSLGYLFTFDLSSGLTLLPGMTIKVKYGASTLTLLNNGLVAVNLSGKGVAVTGRIVPTGAGTQAIYGQIVQDSGVLAGMSTSVTNGTMTTDTTVDQIFSVTVMLSATTGGVTVTPKIANVIFL